jgi:streptogramin lyase
MRWCSALVLVATVAVQAQVRRDQADLPFDRGEAIDLDRVIPANERGIVCLALGEGGKIYGGTTGRAAHLFTYDPATGQAHSLARLQGGIGLSYALVRLPDGSLIAGTQADPTDTAVATDPRAVGKLYRFSPNGTGPAKIEELGVPVPGQGIYTLAYDPKTNTVVGNTWPEGHFFSFDLKTKKVRDHGPIAGYRTYETPHEAADLNRGFPIVTRYPRQVSRAIVVTPEGAAYTGGADGFLFRYDFQTQRLAKLDVRLPAVPGREPWASLDVGVVQPRSNRQEGAYTSLVGGTSDGYLFELRISPKDRHVLRSRGRPSAQGTFQGLVARIAPAGDKGEGQTFYGVVGSRDGMPRGFAFSQGGGTSSVTPGGIPHVEGQPSMVGFGAMISDAQGNVYAGERDRIARLVRFPAQAPANKKTPPRPPVHIPLLGPEPEDHLVRLEGWVVFAPQGTTTDGSGYTAIAVGQDGRVYVGASRYGGYAYLLRFDPRTRTHFMERVVSVADLTGERRGGINTQGKIHALIIVGPDGRIWFATKQAHEVFGTRPEYGEDPEGYPGGHLCYYDPKTGQSRSMGILKRQEGLMGGAIDPARNLLYYRTEPKNLLLSFNIKTGAVKENGHVGASCRYMVIDKDGAVYTTGRGSYLCRYDPRTGYVEDLAVKVEGPGHYEAPYVIALAPNGKLYGAGISHPWITEFDIVHYKPGPFPEVTVRNVAPAAPRGLPVQDIHAGVFGKDGRFYYPLATTGPVAKGSKAEPHLRIMRFDPKTGQSQTVGIPDTSSLDESKVRHAYARDAKYKMDYIQGMVVGADGSLYVMDIYPQLNVVCFPRLTAPQ